MMPDWYLKVPITDWVNSVNNLDERITFAAESGQKQMILSSFGLPEKATMSDWIKAADELNKMG